MRVWPGRPTPLGATWDGEGVNFALFTEHASAVELCLFEPGGRGPETERIPLRERTNRVWHAYLPEVRPGQPYGFRVHGPWDPERGLRFNRNKLLLDPYARAVSGRVAWSDAQFAYRIGDPRADLSFSGEDSAPSVPRSVVVDPTFTWGDDRPPATPWERSVIYECHVKGMTARHPQVPEALRGTFLGLASDPILDHLLSLGVTAVELLPVQHFVVSRSLVEQGLTNYWGYDPIGWFAPDSRYASDPFGAQVTEFKSMVKAFHRVGIEVILDVVYNHTGEGNHLGPSLCFRGLDAPSYYLLDDDPRHLRDFTGCGNSVRVSHARVLQLVLDSLRYWTTEMHVDGFRFDLATTVGRDPLEFDPHGRFFATVQQDPVLSRVKLIAEPWDLGPGGFRLGQFPPGWAEWNSRFRDGTRRFWRGDAGQVPELAYRLSGSSDLFHAGDRGPWASVNFVTCHDGFTLRDLVSYERKRNEANGEDNRDGSDHEWARSWGEEGETGSQRVQQMRLRVLRNFFATLAFSQGVPMLSHGDEIGRTQRGNNNAYCQDNELTWLDWNLSEWQRELLGFVRRVFALRAENPVFRRRRFFSGDPLHHADAKDVSWVREDGEEMKQADWDDESRRVLGMLIHGQASDEVDERGRPNRGETLLLLVNGGHRSRYFQLPSLPEAGVWLERVHTAHPGHGDRSVRKPGVNLAAHAAIFLSHGAPR